MMNIALCDLNHTTVGIHTETMPLAIGLLGSYIIKSFPGKVDVRLFKFEDDFINEIDNWKPDLMGLSLYSWNTKLNLHMAQIAKSKFPNITLVAGGPNIPIGNSETIEFFKSFPFMDLLISKDGEIPFSEITSKLLLGHASKDIIDARLPSTIAFDAKSQTVLRGNVGDKIKVLDEVPSPYLTGLMDKFLQDEKYTLAPFIETNRGCPYQCTFCHTADKYYNKPQWASIERLEQEMEMFGQKYRGRHDIRLFLADNNFGMFKQDLDFAKIVRKVQEKYNWPRYIDVTTGKSQPGNIVKVVNELKWGLVTTASMQTLTGDVLKNISRKNLKYEDYLYLQEQSKLHDRTSSTELILCLPGETYVSFLNTIKQMIDSGIEQLIIYTLMNLNGTPLYEQHKKTPKIISKYRIVPRQFSKLGNDYIFDTEEVIVQTPTFSYEDYLEIRGLAFVIQTVYNASNFPELIAFLKENNISIYDWLIDIHKKIKLRADITTEQLSSFLWETEQELWDTEEDLQNFYSKDQNYNQLISGELGGNLLSKYTYLSRLNGFQAWLDISLDSAKSLLFKSDKPLSKIKIETLMNDFRTFFTYSRDLGRLFKDDDLLASIQKEPPVIKLTYDIPSWSNTVDLSSLLKFQKNHGNYSMQYSEEQITNIQTIASQNPNEQSVKLQYILRGHSRDFWASGVKQ
jgi:radical SAM superfamily enzyme YgiQ (UPF0313 family)